HQDALFGFHPEPHASLRMVEPHGFQNYAVKFHAAFIQVIKMLLSLHFGQADREIRRIHLIFESVLQTAQPAGAVEAELTVRVVVQRTEKRKPLDVVPMEMRDENVRRDGAFLELAAQRLPQNSKPRAA